MPKGKVLVVGMDEAMHEMVAKVVGPKGLAVSSGNTGTEGLALAREGVPVLLVLQKDIPEVGSSSLVRMLRRHSQLRTVPAIFLEEQSSIEGRLAGFGSPGDRFLPAPFQIEDLDRVISDVLKMTRNDEAAQGAGWMMDDLQFTQSLEGTRGSFDDIGTLELLGYLSAEGRTGELVLLYKRDGQREKVRVFFDNGRIKRARIDGTGDPKNEALIRVVVKVKKGKFDFRPRLLNIRDEIGVPTSELLKKATSG